MKDKITVIIADDHPIFQNGLRQIIESDARLKLVATAVDGDEAIFKIRQFRPDVAVLDVDMPKRDGFGVLKLINEESLPVAVVLLTMYKEERFLNAALDSGIKGYVVKDSALTEITDAIRAVANGDNFISPALSTLLLKRIREVQRPKSSILDSLTGAERRVLKLVAEAKSNKEIGDELFISVRTVENHRSKICLKLGLAGKNALLAFALTNKSEI